jgi:hypothetical protein
VGSAAAVKTRASVFNIVCVLSAVGGQRSGLCDRAQFRIPRAAGCENRGGVASQMADRGPDDEFQTANLHFMASHLLYCVTRYYHA